MLRIRFKGYCIAMEALYHWAMFLGPFTAIFFKTHVIIASPQSVSIIFNFLKQLSLSGVNRKVLTFCQKLKSRIKKCITEKFSWVFILLFCPDYNLLAPSKYS